MDLCTDFLVVIDGQTHIHNNYSITDEKDHGTLQTIEDLPRLLRKRWLVSIVPMTIYENKKDVPSLNGIDLVFREGIKVTPIYGEKIKKTL